MIAAISFMGGMALFLMSTVTLARAMGFVIRGAVRSRLYRASVPAGFVVGTAATAAVQSSTLVSVVLLSLVEAGAMEMGPAFAAVVGANVGTTVTAGLAGLRPTVLGWAALAAGLVVLVAAHRRGGGSERQARYDGPLRQAMTGLALFAFSGTVLGLEVIAESSEVAFGSHNVGRLLSLASANTLAGFVGGAAVTATVHSSSLVTVMLVNLVNQGALPLEAALAMMLGSNVGTCFTPLAASVPSGRKARALAVANTMFNLAGSLAFLPVLGPFADWLRSWVPAPGMQLAAGHMVFNVATAAAVLPFCRAVMAMFGAGSAGSPGSAGTARRAGSRRGKKGAHDYASGRGPRHSPGAHRVSSGVEFRPSGAGRVGSRG